MNDALMKVQKRVKIDTIAILVIVILLVVMAGSAVSQAVIQGTKDRDSFDVRLTYDENMQTSYYMLYINGEANSIVDYNEYNRMDSESNQFNPQAALVIEYIVRAVQCLLGAAVFFMIYCIFAQIRQRTSPFTKKNVFFLRAASVLTMLLGLLPGAVKLFISVVAYNSTYVPFAVGSLMIIMIGVVLGMISEVFRYGCELQEDLDQIA